MCHHPVHQLLSIHVHVQGKVFTLWRMKKKTGVIAQGKVNFTLGQLKMEVWWSGERVTLVSVSSLVHVHVHVSENFQ